MIKVDPDYKLPSKIVESIAAAKEELIVNCRYISNNYRKYPSHEVNRILERNFYLLSAIGRNEPCPF